ncbi:MAG TPA: hypothetical protein EYH08_02955 [Pyrodictium sp.]|nr:hypothetical protein [Pyrodictium sp.]
MIHAVVLIVRKLKYLLRRAVHDILFDILVVVVAVWLASGISFSIVEGVDVFTGLYWALVTMATVGYGDITPQTPMGKLIASLTIVAGIVSFTALVSVGAGRIVESAERKRLGYIHYRGRRHIVVIGWTPAAEAAIKELRMRGFRGDIVLVTEKPSAVVREARLEDVTIIRGDITRIDTLLRADVPHASMVIVSTDDDAKTVLAVLAVKALNPHARIVAEALHPENVQLIHKAGADIVVATRHLGGRMLANSLIEPGAAMLLEDISVFLGDRGVQIRELPAGPYAGKKYLDALLELRRKGITLVAVRRGGKLISNPSDDFMIREGDVLIVVVPVKAVEVVETRPTGTESG